MANIRPFPGLRPKKEYVKQVSSPPYDVLNSDEARELVKHNPKSFLHIVKPEVDLEPSVSLYDERVYQKGAENLRKWIDEGIMIQDNKPCFYIYKQIMGNHQQIGLVACASVDDYNSGKIKIHEHTRKIKEQDRTKHVYMLNANTGPVFLTYIAKNEIDELVDNIVCREPLYDFVSEDNVRHTFWQVDNDEDINNIVDEFAKVDYLYVADGHHRSKASALVREIKMKENPNHTGNEEYNYFLSVIFPHNQMYIMDYNRVVKDLNGMTKEEFLKEVSEQFDINFLGKCGNSAEDKIIYRPKSKHQFGMYLDNDCYILIPKPGSFDKNDPVKSLDVSIMQENLLDHILGIKNPREDNRIDFVGGIRGLRELEKLVDTGQYRVAFAMYPTSIEDLMRVADANRVMPPKSTWFEPKLRSGIIVHLLD